MAREMALIDEACERSSVGNGEASAEQCACARYADLNLIGVGRHAKLAAEGAVEMVGAETGEEGEMAEGDALGIVVVEKLLGAAKGEIFVTILPLWHAAGCAVAGSEAMEEGEERVLAVKRGASLKRLIGIEQAMQPQERGERARVVEEFGSEIEAGDRAFRELLDGAVQRGEFDEDDAEGAIDLAIGVDLTGGQDGERAAGCGQGGAAAFERGGAIENGAEIELVVPMAGEFLGDVRTVMELDGAEVVRAPDAQAGHRGLCFVDRALGRHRWFALRDLDGGGQ